MKPTDDIQPLTAFRANVAAFIEQVKRTGRPLVLTQHGKSTAVLLGTADYEALIDELEVLRDIHLSERDIGEGKSIPHDKVVRELQELVRARIAK